MPRSGPDPAGQSLDRDAAETQPRYRSIPGGAVVYDAALLTDPHEALFSSDYWRRRGALTGGAEGRGRVHFVEADGQSWVLRHYQRGGLVARVSRDRYVYTGARRTRIWREWHLLRELYARGLTVPRPVAGRFRRRGPFYTADIITERVEGEPLAAVLAREPLAADDWRELGRQLRAFHDAGAEHPDLNAHNIVLAGRLRAALVDFDRGRLRTAGGRWRGRNLERLRRSLDKLAGERAGFAFAERDWSALMAGYGSAGRGL